MRSQTLTRSHQRGIGLVEVIVVIAVIGVIAAITAPLVGNVFSASEDAKARMNARDLETISSGLASLGVAHVIPESLGGVEATARLIRVGVTVPEGPMAGAKFIMAALSDDDIADMAKYLRVVYDQYELRLEYYDPDDGIGSIEAVKPDRQMLYAYFRPKYGKTYKIVSA